MSQALPGQSGSLPTANEELAAQVAVALRIAGLITASDEDAVIVLLSAGNAKAGDWRRLFEKNLPAATTTDHATTHCPA